METQEYIIIIESYLIFGFILSVAYGIFSESYKYGRSINRVTYLTITVITIPVISLYAFIADIIYAVYILSRWLIAIRTGKPDMDRETAKKNLNALNNGVKISGAKWWYEKPLRKLMIKRYKRKIAEHDNGKR